MPWEYLLGSATGMGVFLVLLILFGQKLMETKINAIFQQKSERLKNELLKDLEKSKSSLGVWAQLRNDVIKELWDVNKQILQKMSSIIVEAQAILYAEKLPNKDVKKFSGKEFSHLIEDYRTVVHLSFHLVDMDKALPIIQDFLECAYKLQTLQGATNSQDGLDFINKLKTIRNDYQAYIVNHFHLKEVMPWMAT